MGKLDDALRAYIKAFDGYTLPSSSWLRERSHPAAENAALRTALAEAERERDEAREALTEIERVYYIEGTDASWRAAHMRAVATEFIEAALAQEEPEDG